MFDIPNYAEIKQIINANFDQPAKTILHATGWFFLFTGTPSKSFKYRKANLGFPYCLGGKGIEYLNLLYKYVTLVKCPFKDEYFIKM